MSSARSVRAAVATVYLAEDVRHGRQVAVKVLRLELAAMVGGETDARLIGVVNWFSELAQRLGRR